MPYKTALATSYYSLLEVHPSASALEIRRSYRELSKRYHPDTTDLPTEVATAKFRQLNEAYATLSSPDRRMAYDLKIGYSRLNVIQAPSNLNHPVSERKPAYSSSAYLDPTDRPLSAGEITALFVLGLTFLGCLLLAIFIGLTRGDAAFRISKLPTALPIEKQLIPNASLTVSVSVATLEKLRLPQNAKLQIPVIAESNFLSADDTSNSKSKI